MLKPVEELLLDADLLLTEAVGKIQSAITLSPSSYPLDHALSNAVNAATWVDTALDTENLTKL